MGVRDKIAKAVMDAVGGIKAYHSSPHDFDRFDLSKIGTGEGAQAYGHGIYAAENPAVSGQGGQYWQQFLNHPALSESQQHAGSRLRAEGFDKEKAIAATQRDVNDWLQMTQPADAAAQLRGQSTSYYDRAHAQKMLALRQAELEALVSGKAGPRTYELNINADPAQMLDWDKPLASHPEAVRESLLNTLEEAPFRRLPRDRVLENALEGIPGHPTGESFYRHLADRGASNVQPLVSERMLMNDIPGIKYLDEGSRHANPVQVQQWQRLLDAATDPVQRAEMQARFDAAGMKPTSNYVVFDPSIIRIDKKYALPGALGAGAMGSLAAQDQYEVAQ